MILDILLLALSFLICSKVRKPHDPDYIDVIIVIATVTIGSFLVAFLAV